MFSSNYEIERMITDFNGVVSIGNNVLCYGNYGIITYSNNKGINWKQLNIGDKYEIKKILNYNNNLYGSTNLGLIKSKDSGLNWEKKDIANLNSMNRFTISSDKIYLQSMGKIQIFDTNLVLIAVSYTHLTLPTNREV